MLGMFSIFNSTKRETTQSTDSDFNAIEQCDEDSVDVSIADEAEGSFYGTKTFTFISDSISQVDISGNHFNYFISKSDDKISVTYSDIVSKTTSKLTFSNDNNEKSLSLYFNCLSGKIYYSFLSEDSLQRYMGLENDINCDNDEIDAEYVSSKFLPQNSIALASSSGICNLGIICGYMKWKNSAGLEFPLAGMKVKIETSVLNYETYTEDDGFYLFYLIDETQPIYPYTDIRLHVYAKSESTSVIYNEKTVYEKCWTNIDLSNLTEAYKLNYTFTTDNDGDLGRAMQIAQAAKYYSDYIKSLNNDTSIAECKFNYPNDASQGCYYVRKTSTVHISCQDSRNGFPESYESWDTIGHEYGHHVQNVFDIANNPGGAHSSSKNDADNLVETSSFSYKNSKDRGLRLAWGESWPTYWSITAQQTFPNDIKEIETVADDSYTAYNGLNYSLDSFEGETIIGEGCERAIMRFLYKLYSDDTDDIDKFALGDVTLWNIVSTAKPYYFYQFVSALYSKSYSNNDLGLLLENYGMAATNLTVSNSPSANTPPSFSWVAQGGSKYFPNDLFTLSFYNQYKNKVIDIMNIDSNSYSLSTSQWNTILHEYGSRYYVMVSSYASNYLSTGPYYSMFYEFTKPTNSSELTSSVTISNRVRYYEKIYDILPNSITTLNIKFERSGYNVLQTFGTSDVCMYLYSSDGKTMLAYNDDNGYRLNAWIYSYFNSSNSYQIKIRSLNQEKAAITKLAITPAHNFKNNSDTSLASYDNIWHIHDTTNYYLTSYGEQYYSEMLTFTPKESGTYTIDLTSQFDNYLYIIDPRSPTPLILDKDYNDDSNGRNASLTKSLTANVKYYIVFSQFNPSLAMENLDEYDNCYVHIHLN